MKYNRRKISDGDWVRWRDPESEKIYGGRRSRAVFCRENRSRYLGAHLQVWREEGSTWH